MLLSFNVTSTKERSGRDRWNIREDVVSFQVPSEDSQEVAGICGRADEPGLAYTHRLSYCWVICTSSFQTVCVLLQLRET